LGAQEGVDNLGSRVEKIASIAHAELSEQRLPVVPELCALGC
jgi:hypothetical protein